MKGSIVYAIKLNCFFVSLPSVRCSVPCFPDDYHRTFTKKRNVTVLLVPAAATSTEQLENWKKGRGEFQRFNWESEGC